VIVSQNFALSLRQLREVPLQVGQHHLVFEPKIKLLLHVFALALLALSSLQIPQVLALQKPNHISDDDALIRLA